MRYELTDNEWSAIKPMLPNKPRGRALLQQDQALPPGCNALRQARRELPCVRSTRVDQAMASR
jgi:transposase